MRYRENKRTRDKISEIGFGSALYLRQAQVRQLKLFVMPMRAE